MRDLLCMIHFFPPPVVIAGQVSDLKGHFVTQVAMGKAHTCVLTKSGEVWTFGVNNKGQCGRDTGAMSQAGKGENRLIKFSKYTF